MNGLEANYLTLAYGDVIVIENLDVHIPKGGITVFVGANGCGKSTLLRSLARLLKPKSGNVLLDGNRLEKLSTKDIAKQLAILPQAPLAPEGLTVLELVKQGRYPHQNWLQQWSKQDESIVNKALESTGMKEFADRSVESMSGGQKQRAWIAMTLAQKTEVILLDEPTTYLDLAHQIDVLDLLFDLNKREGRTVIMVLHDLNLACRYADHIISVCNKQIYAQGKPENVITSKMMKAVFNLDCDITEDPIFGTPLCIPHGKGRFVTEKLKNKIV